MGVKVKVKQENRSISEWLRRTYGGVKPKDYAERIAELRNRFELTQVEFGEALGVSHAAVSAWERGKYPPSPEAFVRLGNLADYPLSMWFWHLAGVDPERILISFVLYQHYRQYVHPEVESPEAHGEMTLKKAASYLRMPPSALEKLIVSGEVKARQFGPKRLYLVNIHSVHKLLKKRVRENSDFLKAK